MKVNKKIIREWVKALRSGKYNQGYGQLYDGKCHCVVGVLCEVAGKSRFYKGKDGFYHYGNVNGHTGYIPEIIRNRVGIDDLFIKNKDGRRKSIMWLNDVEECDFTQLAELIERNYLK